jgi:hypothetical protein
VTHAAPISPPLLAATIAEEALARRSEVGWARVAVDGPVEPDTGALADAVAEALTAHAVPVARVSARDFLRARSLRLEHGGDPDVFLHGWYDLDALRREVLDPLGPAGSLRWLPRLRDPITDRSVREPRRTAVPGTVAVLDGRFLLGPLRDAVDVAVHLEVSPAARARRVPSAEAYLVLPAWERYLAEVGPAERADLVVRFDHPDRPALATPKGR